MGNPEQATPGDPFGAMIPVPDPIEMPIPPPTDVGIATRFTMAEKALIPAHLWVEFPSALVKSASGRKSLATVPLINRLLSEALRLMSIVVVPLTTN